MKCPVCGQSELAVFFEADRVPVFCNILHPSREEARDTPRGEIRLGFCDACAMIYNVAFDPDSLSYTPGYENSLYGSPRFQAYAEEVAERLVRKFGLIGAEIVDVGCGRGEFLALLCRGGRNRGTGFDPSLSREEAEAPDRPYRLVPQRFPESGPAPPADLVCARHVIEHLADPLAFARRLGVASRNRRPAIFLEVPNGLWILGDSGVWDVIYEHCSYFVPDSLRRLARRAGLEPVEIYESFGGQFLCAESSSSGQRGPRTTSETGPARLRERVAEFDSRRRDRVAKWSARLEYHAAKGERIAIWGAGSKGVTFVNSVAPSEAIGWMVDINPRKHGRFVPGTGHLVVGPEDLRGAAVAKIVVMNPAYSDEVRRMAFDLGLEAEVSDGPA